MKSPDNKHRRKAIALLVMYLTILTVSILHVHSYGHGDDVCQDCISHVQHKGHLVQGTFMDHDCVLCHFLHLSYLPPQVVVLTAASFVVIMLTRRLTQRVVCRSITLPGLRGPPSITSAFFSYPL